MSIVIKTKFLFQACNFYFEQVHKYQEYTFLFDCGHFELSGANDILKHCQTARSDKSLKQNYCINVLPRNYFIQRNT